MLTPSASSTASSTAATAAAWPAAALSVAFGDYGLQALEPAWVTNRQIEAARIAMTSLHQAWRQGLDQHLPGQAGDQEAGRDPHGLGQGLAGVVGRGGPAGPG